MLEDLDKLAGQICETEQFEKLFNAKKILIEKGDLFNEVVFYEQKKKDIIENENNTLRRKQLMEILNKQHKKMLGHKEVDVYLSTKNEFLHYKKSAFEYITRKVYDYMQVLNIE